MIFRLVTSLRDEFAAKFDTLFQDCASWYLAMTPTMTEQAVDAYNQLIVLLCLHHVSGFFRRIGCHTKRPLKDNMF